jgi:hypothetical protein
MDKLVCESLNELYGESPYSSEETNSELMNVERESEYEDELANDEQNITIELEERFGNSIDIDEFTLFCQELVELGDASEAVKKLKFLLQMYPELYDQEGEISDYYKEGIDIFLSGYPDMVA